MRICAAPASRSIRQIAHVAPTFLRDMSTSRPISNRISSTYHRRQTSLVPEPTLRWRPNAKDKGKDRGVKSQLPLSTSLIKLLADCLQRGSSPSSTVRPHHAVPTSKEQENLFNLLRTIQAQTNRHDMYLPPRDFVTLHDRLVYMPEQVNAYLQQISGRTDIIIPPCEPSTQSFELLLKHAALVNNTRVLRIVSKHAMLWHNSRRALVDADTSVAEQLEQLHLEKVQTKALVRNLRLAASTRIGTFFQVVKDDDDIFALRKFQRFSFRMFADVHRRGRIGLKTSRMAKHLFKMHYDEQYILREVDKIAIKIQEELQFPTQQQEHTWWARRNIGDAEPSSAEQELFKLLEIVLPQNEDWDETAAQHPSKGLKVTDELQKQHHNRLRAWRSLIKHRSEQRRRALSQLFAFLQPRLPHAKAGNGDAKADDGDAKRMSGIPTWILLDALRNVIGAGLVERTEQIVTLYLSYLQEKSGKNSLKDITHLIPINDITFAVTQPHHPPKSPVLLNAILRAHLNRGEPTAWWDMLDVIEKWCCGGRGFKSFVTEVCGMRQKQALPSDQVQKTQEKVRHSQCLYPNETTVTLLLKALPTDAQHPKSSQGRSIVRAFNMRWSPHSMQMVDRTRLKKNVAKGQEFTGYPNHSTHQRPLHFTMRTFSRLLHDAVQAQSVYGVRQSLRLHSEWMRCMRTQRTLLPFFDFDKQPATINKPLRLQRRVDDDDKGNDASLTTAVDSNKVDKWYKHFYGKQDYRRAVFDRHTLIARRRRRFWIHVLGLAVRNGTATSGTVQAHFERWDYLPKTFLPVRHAFPPMQTMTRTSIPNLDASRLHHVETM